MVFTFFAKKVALVGEQVQGKCFGLQDSSQWMLVFCLLVDSFEYVEKIRNKRNYFNKLKVINFFWIKQIWCTRNSQKVYFVGAEDISF